MVPEAWKPVVGYEGVYEVSEHGSVRRVRSGAGATSGRVLKLIAMPSGHLRVKLSDYTRREDRMVHRLVHEAFGPPAPSTDSYVLHNDGDPTNNSKENLRWGTQADNIADAVRHGTLPKGVSHHAAKLDPTKVREIRRLLSEGVPQRKVAAAFNVPCSTISKINTGKAWKHVT